METGYLMLQYVCVPSFVLHITARPDMRPHTGARIQFQSMLKFHARFPRLLITLYPSVRFLKIAVGKRGGNSFVAYCVR